GEAVAQFPGGGAPDLHGEVVAPRGQEPAVGRELHGRRPGQVGAGDGQVLGSGRRVPDLYLPHHLAGRGGEAPAVGAERQAPAVALLRAVAEQLPPTRRVPDADVAVAAVGETASVTADSHDLDQRVAPPDGPDLAVLGFL